MAGKIIGLKVISNFRILCNYKTYVAAHPSDKNRGVKPPRMPRLASSKPSESPVNRDDVWVNTKSGNYWKPGPRYYGKTKQVECLSKEEAVQKGYRPANGTGD